MRHRSDRAQTERFHARVGADETELNGLIHQSDDRVLKHVMETIERITVRAESHVKRR